MPTFYFGGLINLEAGCRRDRERLGAFVHRRIGRTVAYAPEGHVQYPIFVSVKVPRVAGGAMQATRLVSPPGGLCAGLATTREDRFENTAMTSPSFGRLGATQEFAAVLVAEWGQKGA